MWIEAGGSITNDTITLPNNTSDHYQLYYINWFIVGPNANPCSTPTITLGLHVTFHPGWAQTGDPDVLDYAATSAESARYSFMALAIVQPGSTDSSIVFDTDGLFPNGTSTVGNLVIMEVNWLGYD
jgi:hypothetical protein